MGCLANLRAGALTLIPRSCRAPAASYDPYLTCLAWRRGALARVLAECAGGRGTRRNINSGVSVVNYAGFGAEYAVSVCVNGLQWVSSTPNFRTLRAEVAAKVTLTHEKEGSDGTRRHY